MPPSRRKVEPSPLETKILRPLPDPALEAFRSRVLRAVTLNGASAPAARAVVQMAFETELRAVLTKLIKVAPDLLAATVPERRRFLEVDADLGRYGFLVEPALAALSSAVPDSYVRLLRRYLGSRYARYRVSATCAVLCLAATTRSSDDESP